MRVPHTSDVRRTVATILLAALGLTGAAAATHQTSPELRIVDRSPVVVRGGGFGARESVLVTVRTGLLRATQRTTATQRGRFVVRVDEIRLTPCAGGAIVATGALGHTARLKLRLRECPGPALDP